MPSRKLAKCEAICELHHFKPVAVERLRALANDAMAFLKELGCRIAAVTKERRAFEFLMQRISVAVQRGNAACILGTLPSILDLDEIFRLV